MTDKTFTVTHAHARAPLTIKGKTLEEALEKEGLDPIIWKEVPPPGTPYGAGYGDNQGDAGSEDN